MASSASHEAERSLSFRCPEGLAARLERVAASEDRSVSAVLRLALTRYVVQAEGEQTPREGGSQ